MSLDRQQPASQRQIEVIANVTTKTKNKSQIGILSSLQDHGRVLSVTDFAFSKRSQEALRQSEQKYRDLVEMSNSIIMTVDKDLNITYINEFGLRFFGYEASEMFGRNVVGTTIPPRDDQGNDLASMAGDILRRPHGYTTNVHKNMRKDGSLVWVSWTNKARYNDQGELIEILSVGNDITKLKQAQESMGRFKALMDHNPSLVFLKDESGRYVYLNRAYEEHFVLAKDWYGKTDFDFWPKESAELFRAHDAQVMQSGKTCQFLEDSRDRNGARYCWLCYKFCFTDSMNKRYIGGIGIDATDRVVTEETLKWRAQRDKLLSEVMARLLESGDPQSLVEELCRNVMKFLDCQAFFNFLADDNAERMHLNACAGICDEEAKKIEWLDYGAAVCGCVARDHQRIIAEDIQNKPDKRTELIKSYGMQAYCCHPLIVEGMLIGTLSFGTTTRPHFSADEIELMQDVSRKVAIAMHRIKMEQKISAQNELLERLFAKIPVLLVMWDPRLERFTLNKHTESVMGWTTQDANDGDFMSKVYPDPDYRKQVCDYMQMLEPGWKEWNCTAKDGRTIPIDWANIRLADNTMIGIGVDLRQRKAAEEALRKAKDELEQRVAERTAEVSARTEQLRALAIQLSRTEQQERKRFAKILHDHIQQSIVAARMQLAPMKNYVDCQSTVQEVDAILKETLEASRSLSIDLSPPVLHQSGLVAALGWLAARMRDKNGFTVNVDADSSAEPVLEETRFLLFECVRELLFNSLKHSGIPEAYVTLKRLDDKRLQLVVCDRGKGFDPDMLKNLGPDEVTYGLFSIRERLTYLGGQIKMDTAPGKGACFIITVESAAAKEPCIDSTGQKTNQHASENYPDKSNQCRVIICDDHKIVREGLARLLQSDSQIKVVGQAENGMQAIELVKKHLPDTVIMDVNMNEMNGIEATKRIISINPKIKVIGLSMHEDLNVSAAMHAAGAFVYLSKTGASENLITLVKSCRSNQE